ncbi:peroxisomal membrane protein PEX14 [Durio zibethinus]|uniref:Peroxisomal membrane protein PEX14 n=1 Tax=Durio zibethinus TaxID=66656 RepID=A0A6P5XES6_DURZI|nr:peroxisomal membrane protein PEX14 [Durio zibethinus]
MATTQSPAPPNTDEDKPQTISEVVQQANEVQQDVRPPEATKQNVPASVFVNSEPIREDQVLNAVKFLSHPKVRGSPVVYRRSFLERKGLTKEEIDEAFRRVPDPPPSSQLASLNQDGQVKPSSTVQTQATTQTPQPVAAAPASTGSVGILAGSRFHWYHAVFAVGLLAASGAGTAVLIKNAIIPRLKSWIRKVVLEEENDHAKSNAKPSLAEEAAAAAKAAAAAAADVAKASQEMLNSKNEERRHFEEFMNLIDVQVQEMKSMSNAIRKLEGQANSSGRTFVDHEDHRVSASSAKHSYANGKMDADVRSVRSSSLPASAEPPHPKSYMEIMAMVQRGEKPSNIREINDMPPNPNQQPSYPRRAPRTKPWEAQNGSSQVLQSQGSAGGLNQKVQDNGLNYLVDNESSTPWWQRKNVRITEIENEDEGKAGPYGVRTNEQPIPRTWVPPQPPPVAMPEAAEAIRQPKLSAQRETSKQEQLADDQSVALPSEVDELQRITEISESAGAVEMNGGVSGVNSTEIQEQEHSFEGN